MRRETTVILFTSTRIRAWCSTCPQPTKKNKKNQVKNMSISAITGTFSGRGIPWAWRLRRLRLKILIFDIMYNLNYQNYFIIDEKTIQKSCLGFPPRPAWIVLFRTVNLRQNPLSPPQKNQLLALFQNKLWPKVSFQKSTLPLKNQRHPSRIAAIKPENVIR